MRVGDLMRAPGSAVAPRAQPPLTVTVMFCPAALIVAAAVSDRILSATSMALASLVRGRMTRNSSPPHRPAMSPAGAPRCRMSNGVQQFVCGAAGGGQRPTGSAVPTLSKSTSIDAVAVRPTDLLEEAEVAGAHSSRHFASRSAKVHIVDVGPIQQMVPGQRRSLDPRPIPDPSKPCGVVFLLSVTKPPVWRCHHTALSFPDLQGARVEQLVRISRDDPRRSKDHLR